MELTVAQVAAATGVTPQYVRRAIAAGDLPALRQVGRTVIVDDLAVQVWEWHGDQYDLRLYLTTEAADGRAHTDVQVTRYRAVTIDHLLALMRDAGFSPCERRDGVLFQPVLWGRKPS